VPGFSTFTHIKIFLHFHNKQSAPMSFNEPGVYEEAGPAYKVIN